MGLEVPSLAQVEAALERAEIDAQAFADIRSRWAGSAGLVAGRLRPVAMLLGLDVEEFEAAALDTDALTDWLAQHVPQWDTLELLSSARRSRDDHAMGLAAWRALGDAAELPAWNEALGALGDEYEPVENKAFKEQADALLEAAQASLTALAREIAAECGEPSLFQRIEDATRAFVAPDEWSERWWKVPFAAVADALQESYRDVVDTEHLDVLRGARSADGLRAALEKRGIGADPDPYETARRNREAFTQVLVDVHDLYRTWLDINERESEAPEGRTHRNSERRRIFVGTPAPSCGVSPLPS